MPASRNSDPTSKNKDGLQDREQIHRNKRIVGAQQSEYDNLGYFSYRKAVVSSPAITNSTQARAIYNKIQKDNAENKFYDLLRTHEASYLLRACWLVTFFTASEKEELGIPTLFSNEPGATLNRNQLGTILFRMYHEPGIDKNTLEAYRMKATRIVDAGIVFGFLETDPATPKHSGIPLRATSRLDILFTEYSSKQAQFVYESLTGRAYATQPQDPGSHAHAQGIP